MQLSFSLAYPHQFVGRTSRLSSSYLVVIWGGDITMISGFPRHSVIFPDMATVRPSLLDDLRKLRRTRIRARVRLPFPASPFLDRNKIFALASGKRANLLVIIALMRTLSVRASYYLL
jgi:hypothetical protein